MISSSDTTAFPWSKATAWSGRDTGRLPGSAHPRGPSMAAAPARASEAPQRPRAVAHVDLGAVERNCATLKRRLGAAELCAVVKADGYGHGATPCARAAARRRCDLARGRDRRGGGRAARRRDRRADPGDGSADRRRAGGRARGGRGRRRVAGGVRARGGGRAAPDRPARVHVKLDTGMGRLGAKDPEQARGSPALDASDRASSWPA